MSVFWDFLFFIVYSPPLFLYFEEINAERNYDVPYVIFLCFSCKEAALTSLDLRLAVLLDEEPELVGDLQTLRSHEQIVNAGRAYPVVTHALHVVYEVEPGPGEHLPAMVGLHPQHPDVGQLPRDRLSTSQ